MSFFLILWSICFLFGITPVHVVLQKMKTTTPVNCNYTHNVPVIVFSFGLIGNLFHEISEIVIPLFITARHFGSSVHFMVTDYQPWFAHKYNRILAQLYRYQVIDTTLNASDHCFPGAVVGLKYHGNLALNPDSIPRGHTMLEFKELLIFLSQEEGTTSSAYRGKPKYDVSSDPTPRITTTSSDSEKQVDHLETNAGECLKREKDRVSHYLHSSSEPKLLEVVFGNRTVDMVVVVVVVIVVVPQSTKSKP
ncbi:xylan glycosyltransferase MUCI21 [Lactuca sativa]|uniref:xylan glycosyltransferase MUCI21 n=1 Tax=Lactuca sativa TaxID=4236 RepID=UPI0022AF792A|nr:xylan glycosyltransferase MUCI21 [Lactuca sativa]